MTTSPTKQIYGALEYAVTYFRYHLFKGELPEIVITLKNKNPKISGFHLPGSYIGRESPSWLDEVAL